MRSEASAAPAPEARSVATGPVFCKLGVASLFRSGDRRRVAIRWPRSQ